MYAHVRIEDSESGNTFLPGDEVPDDLPGIDELKEYGSVSDEEYTGPARVAHPVIDVDGTLYIKADEVTRKISDARSKLAAGDISSEEFEEIVMSITETNYVASGDDGESGEGSQ